jgi:endonuclease/exonuclease/phosphatase family metal-dependent hydrolase
MGPDRALRRGLVAMTLLAAACSADPGATSATTTTTVATPASTPASTTSSLSTTGTEAPISVEFELMTYNVAGLPTGLSKSEPAINTPIIGPRLNDYDIVLVQESWLTAEGASEELRNFHEILLDLADHEYESVPVPQPLGSDPRRPSALASDGLNRFSVYPFEPVEHIAWTTCGLASADCFALKGFSVATVTFADGVEAEVYNLHMDAGREDFAVRAENVAELIADIETRAAGKAVIVAGDFNLHLDRDPDAAQFAEVLAATGLTDVCTELGCDEPNLIDRVLYRPGDIVTIAPLEWRNDGAAFTRDDGEPLSDHDPIVVRFEISAS